MPITDGPMAPGKIATAVTRRGLLGGAASLLALVMLGLPWGSPAQAAATDQASALVDKLATELTALVGSGKTAAQLQGSFKQILVRYADMPAVSGSVLGPPWRTATPQQQKQFVAAFQTYLARKYGAQFGDYKNAQIVVKGAKDGGKAGVLVNTQVMRPGKEPVAVDWQISDRSGSPRVVNLVIEGVSMLATERAEVGAMLDAGGGSLDKLIAKLATPS